jgi:hypothetical protein
MVQWQSCDLNPKQLSRSSLLYHRLAGVQRVEKRTVRLSQTTVQHWSNKRRAFNLARPLRPTINNVIGPPDRGELPDGTIVSVPVRYFNVPVEYARGFFAGISAHEAG